LRHAGAGLSLIALMAIAGSPALAGPKKENAAPSHAAPASHGGGGAGGAHVPGSMGGGAHIPGSMGGGAHVPGSMGGGAHVPGSMAGGAHIPGSMGGAHVPGSMGGAHVAGSAGAHGTGASAAHVAGGAHGSNSGHYARSATPSHAAAATAHAGREPAGDARIRSPAEAHGGERQAAAAAHPAARQDSRLGGHAASNTRGLDAAREAPHAPRPFLRADAHRDIAHDHEFADRHAHDFHTRSVRDFSARELAAWRGGDWRNEWHYGRRGWWWEVDGVWYPYDEPIWPYPLDVAPLVVYDTPYIDGPDLTAYETGADPAIPPLPPPPVGWFRCESTGVAFPVVTACGGSWDLVADASPPRSE
jgi:hypothetical protein